MIWKCHTSAHLIPPSKLISCEFRCFQWLELDFQRETVQIRWIVRLPKYRDISARKSVEINVKLIVMVVAAD